MMIGKQGGHSPVNQRIQAKDMQTFFDEKNYKSQGKVSEEWNFLQLSQKKFTSHDIFPYFV